MGMGVGELEVVKHLKAAGYLSNGRSVIEIGAQQLEDSIFAASTELEGAKPLFGINTPPPAFARSADRSPDNLMHGSPLARDLWKWLGFEYASIDIDGTPGSIPLDLNFDDVPKSEIGKYSLVTNFGTTEHTINQMQAFKVIHDLAAVDGIMLHNVPMGGMFSHGLISYNPNFFWALSRANGYKIVFMTLSANPDPKPFPDDIISEVARNDRSLPKRFANYRAAECAIIVALHKQFDAPFVPPLDLPDMATTENAEMMTRYWSIFRPDPLPKRLLIRLLFKLLLSRSAR
jgi:hypothetical protein